MKINLNSVKLGLFLLYNVAYLLCMFDIIGSFLYFGFIILFLLICIIQTITKHKKINNEGKQLYSIFFTYAILALISLIIQIKNSDFQTYLFSDLLYLILPPILAFFWIKSTPENQRKKYLYIMFIRMILNFILQNMTNFSLNAILAIDWNDTKSSLFESSLAHDFFIFEIIMIYFDDKKSAIIAMLCCMLSFKRLSFILSLVVFIIYMLNKAGKWIFSKNKIDIKNYKLPKIINIIIVLVLCISPYFMKWVAIDGGASWVLQNTGIDLEEMSTGRLELIRYTNSHINHFNGLGSIINFFKHSKYKELGNMHCDILRIYWETGIIGIILFSVIFSKYASKNWAINLIWIYIAVELISSHFLHMFSTWIVFFFFAEIVYNKELKNDRFKEKIE